MERVRTDPNANLLTIDTKTQINAFIPYDVTNLQNHDFVSRNAVAV